MKQPPTIVLAWFRAADWPRLLRVADDRARLPSTFEEFSRRASIHLAALRRQDLRVEPVLINVDQLVSWCHTQGRPVDASARAEFAALAARRRGLH